MTRTRLLGRVWAVRKGRRWLCWSGRWLTRFAITTEMGTLAEARSDARFHGAEVVPIDLYAAPTPKPRKPR